MYAELHCKTNFSFLEGASHADELVSRATELGYHAIAVTDRNSLAGIVRAHIAAQETGLKLLVGAEITPEDAPPVLLWATNRAAYGKLSRLITVGRRRAPKGECQTFLADIAEHSTGLIAGVCPNVPSCGQNPTDHGIENTAYPKKASQLVRGEKSHLKTGTLETYHQYRDIFGDQCYLMLELLRGSQDALRFEHLQKLSEQTQLPLLAAGDVHYHVPERLVLHDVLHAIRNSTTVDRLSELPDRFANAQRHLRPLDEIRRVYAAAPAAIERTVTIARCCTFSLDELRYEYPEELAPANLTPYTYLEQLTWQGADTRFPSGIPEKVRNLVHYELGLIKELQYEAYFLTVWDLVRFARQRDILCQGRGSAANSAVCFCLGITSVNPAKMDVLFERFVSRERDEAPDIDVDFEHERREEVLQYLYNKYGRERAGLAATVITYRVRSAVRDAGKALGLSLDRVDALAKQVEGYSREANLDDRCRQVGINPDTENGRRLVYCIENMVGFPRHLSQHVGGMVMTRGPLCELVPIENAAMVDRTVISWDKNDLESLGILKVDCLSLGMLTAIRKALALVEQHTGREWTLATVPQDDPNVYDMICRADTMGVFQIESRAQMSMLPRLKPRCYYDLVIEVAIVRPGPIQGQMVHPYLRRRAGDEEVTYATKEIEAVLHKTLGVPIFQEQAMRMAVVAAGFTPGEADQLRRAMGAWRRPGIIDEFRHKLITGMLDRGLEQQFAEQLFNQIRGFGEYGFPESHAASFALLVYVSAWIKHYYPAVFAAAIINSQPMGFYAPSQLVRDARSHGVQVLPVDVNASDWDCTLAQTSCEQLPVNQKRIPSAADKENDAPPPKATTKSQRLDSPFALRLGMRLLRGFSEQHAQQIVAARANGPFQSQAEFAKRTNLSRAVITQLAEADAFASLGRDRRQALWEALAQEKTANSMPLFSCLESTDEKPVALPELDDLSQVFTDFETTGLSLRAHPIAFYRERLAQLDVRSAADLQELPNDHSVCVAGIVLMRQRPSTAKGITFVTLEDETGVINLVVHQRTWERYYSIARRCPAWVAFGRLETKHTVIHVVTSRLVDFASFTGKNAARLTMKSRDFR